VLQRLLLLSSFCSYYSAGAAVTIGIDDGRIRSIQRKEGNQDWFQRTSGDCDQESCSFRPYCLGDSGGAFGWIQMMEKPINILYIDSDWKVIYFHIQNGVTIKSIVPLEPAIFMLKNVKFDLILSEPQNIAILTPQQTNELDYLSNGQLN
jgi:hypothetical protein